MSSVEWKGLKFTAGDRTILDMPQGSFRKQKLTCILGPSGTGKTSLLNILAGRVSSKSGVTKISGSVFLDQKQITPSKQRFAYVMQEDNLFAMATARETMELSAALRGAPNPKEVTDCLIKKLGLSHCAETLVGSATIKGLSGGEKKRVSVGVELVNLPKLLYLDEPTSGLDSYSTLQLVRTLQGLSSDSTIVCTIHQPSSEVFHMFDDVIFLSKGGILYHGPVHEVSQWCSKVGHPCPVGYNVADHMMSLIQVLDQPALDAIRSIPADAWSDEGEADNLEEETKRSSFSEESQSITTPPTLAPWPTQFWLLFGREWQAMIRDGSLLRNVYGLPTWHWLFLSFILQAAGNNMSEKYLLVTHMGAVIFLFNNLVIAAMTGTIFTFPAVRPVFIREFSSGMYDIIPYFCSKNLAEVPGTLLKCTTMICISYPVLQLHGNILHMIGAAFVMMLAASSLSVCIGCFTNNIQKAQSLMPIVITTQICFAGIYIPISLIHPALAWIQYLCFLNYGIKLAALIEFADPVVTNVNGAEIGVNEEIFAKQMINPSLYWTYFGILFGIMVIFRTLAAVGLYRNSKKSVY